MSKNYFTDEQVKSLVKTSMPWAENMQLSIPQLAEFKALMNLAVEAAIGEPYLNVDYRMIQNVNWIKVNDLKNKSPLYSVKELEN